MGDHGDNSENKFSLKGGGEINHKSLILIVHYIQVFFVESKAPIRGGRLVCLNGGRKNMRRRNGVTVEKALPALDERPAASS